MSENVIEIPVGGGEVLEVELDQLSNKEMMHQIRKILVDELAEIRLFLKFSQETYKIGLFDEFEAFSNCCILTVGGRPAVYAQQMVPYCLLLNSLAAHSLDKARKVDKKDGIVYIQRATQVLNLAVKAVRRDPMTRVHKGQLCVVKGELDAAYIEFTQVLKEDPGFVPALLSLADLNLKRKEYSHALGLYQQVLQTCNCASVRHGIAYCFYKLDRLDQARDAFARILQLDPCDVAALVSLAQMDWNLAHDSPYSQILLQNANVRLSKAFSIQPTDLALTETLADRLFRRGDFSKCESVCRYSISKGSTFTWGILGKIQHSRGEWDEALKSLSLAPPRPDFLYSLGRVCIKHGQRDRAVTVFKELVQVHPCFEAYKVWLDLTEQLAILYSDTNNSAALECFENIKQHCFDKDKRKFITLVDDIELLLVYGYVFEKVDVAVSLQELKSTPSPQLLNNIAVLHHTLGQIVLAKTFYTQATSCADEDTKTTILYNVARMYEDEGNSERATDFYKQILREHPSYTDASIRLGIILLQRGDVSAALETFKDVLVIQRNIDAMLLLGQCYLRMGQLRECKKTWETILVECDSHDTYTLVCMGNLYVKFANKQTGSQRDTFFMQALAFFQKALKLDHSNYCAVVGIGICCAHFSPLESVKDIFAAVVGCDAGIALNLAHVLVELNSIPHGISVYESAVKKTSELAYCYSSLSRAYYINAKNAKSLIDIRKALVCIQKAMHLSPSFGACYNIALLLQQAAHILNDQPAESRTLEALSRAQAGLLTSRALFKALSEMSGGGGFDVKHAAERFNYCKEVLRVVEKKIHETRVLGEERARRLLEIQNVQAQFEIEKEEGERKRKIEEELVEARILEERRILQARIQGDIEIMKSDKGEEKVRKGEERAIKKRKMVVGSDDEL